MPDFDTFSEVILFVEDVDRGVSFYADVLGLEATAGDPEHGFVRLDAGGCDLCLHAGGSGDVGSDAPTVVFEVDDLEEARSHLLEHDVDLSDVRSPAPGVRVCDGTDPDGHVFSIESSSASG